MSDRISMLRGSCSAAVPPVCPYRGLDNPRQSFPSSAYPAEPDPPRGRAGTEPEIRRPPDVSSRCRFRLLPSGASRAGMLRTPPRPADFRPNLDLN
jgi:hypothetical protein